MRTPITDLGEILDAMRITDAGDYVYTLTDSLPDDVTPLAVFREREGMSTVIPVEAARAHGFAVEEVFTCLTLDVYSALTSVGLTAAVSTALADAGIPCNVVAGYYHDHLLVPARDKTRAMEALGRVWR